MLKIKSVFPVFIFLMLAIETIFYCFFDGFAKDINLKSYLTIVVSIVCFTIILFIRNNYSLAKKLGALQAVVLFLIGFVIVHFQSYLDFILGISKDQLLRTSTFSIVRSALLSIIGLHSFLLAYSITKNKVFKMPKYTLSSIHISPRILILLTGLSLLWLLYCGQGYYFHMSYGSVSTVGNRLAYAMLIFSLFKNITILVCVCLFQQNKNRSILGFIKSMGVSFNLILLVFIIATFSSGDRGPAIFTIISYLVAISVATNKKIRYSHFVILMIAGALFISVWGVVRTSKSMQNLTGQITNAYNDLKSEQSIIPATSELASSIRTLHVGVELVPDKYPYAYGVFQLSYIIESIPFYSRVFPVLHSSVGFNRSTAFLTWIINGDIDSSGVGTTCIADAYMDLGVFGVIIILFLWGIVVKRSETLFMVPISSLSLFQVALSFIVISVSIYIPRSAVLFLLKDVVWLFLALLLFVLFSSKKAK